MKRISIIGSFAFGKTELNGQTVKTQIFAKELQRIFGCDYLQCFDTSGGKSVVFKSFSIAISALKKSKNVIIFPAQNGLRVFAPLLIVLRNTLFKDRKLHYVVIGGWLPQFLRNRAWLTRVLKQFNEIYVETMSMKNSLDAMGFSNVSVVPNCKNLSILSDEELVCQIAKPYKLCTFSRVMKEKGIKEAVDAVKSINERHCQHIYTLTIYGQVDANQIEWFSELQKTFPDYVKYAGIVPFDRSTEILKDYYALLFPTYYEGEGFAGTLIDALAAGIPVIASDWKYNSEIVKDGITGYIYKIGDTVAFESLLKKILDNPNKFNQMKHSCIKEAHNYLPENVVSLVASKII